MFTDQVLADNNLFSRGLCVAFNNNCSNGLKNGHLFIGSINTDWTLISMWPINETLTQSEFCMAWLASNSSVVFGNKQHQIIYKTDEPAQQWTKTNQSKIFIPHMNESFEFIYQEINIRSTHNNNEWWVVVVWSLSEYF